MKQRMMIPISGMTCESCIEAVRIALAAMPGSQVDAVSIGSATVTYDPARTSPTDLAKAVLRAGYSPVAANSLAYAGTFAGRHGCCGGGAQS